MSSQEGGIYCAPPDHPICLRVIFFPAAERTDPGRGGLNSCGSAAQCDEQPIHKTEIVWTEMEVIFVMLFFNCKDFIFI
jgi:hypothetical protein